MLSSKHVVLVNEQDEVLGIMDKLLAHNAHTPLHRGFSVLLFNNERKLLIQKRHDTKKTWPGFWSNSFCGHPQLGETYEQAIHRHAEFELNIKPVKIDFVVNYRYCFSWNEVMENEICPVYLAISNDVITPNDKEIEAIKWINCFEVSSYLEQFAQDFTPWSKEEISLLQQIHPNIFKN